MLIGFDIEQNYYFLEIYFQTLSDISGQLIYLDPVIAIFGVTVSYM